MTNSTEALESERARKLAHQIATQELPSEYLYGEAVCALIVTALRRLATPDQKPVAYVPISKSPDDRGQPIWRETRPAGSLNPWTGYECENLYLSSPPAAGWDEATEAAMAAVETLRINVASDLTDPRYSGQRGMDRCDALHDAFQVLKALRHNAPPDSGATKSADEWDGLDCGCGGGWKVGHNAGCLEADHGGADSGVGRHPTRLAPQRTSGSSREPRWL